MVSQCWLLSRQSLILTLAFLMLLGPASMQVRGSILRRMPIFYGKRDSTLMTPFLSAKPANGDLLWRLSKNRDLPSFPQFRLPSLLKRHPHGQNQLGDVPGWLDMKDLLGESSSFSQTGNSNRGLTTLRELLQNKDELEGTRDAAEGSLRSSLISAQYETPARNMHRGTHKNLFPETFLYALTGKKRDVFMGLDM